MKREDFNLYHNKKIKIFLKNSFQYTGQIIKVNDESVVINDKFNKLVTISIPEISYVEEMGDCV